MGPRVLDHYVQREMNKTNWWIAHVPFENFMHMMHAQCQTKTKITITTKHNTLTELPSPQFIVYHSWSIAIRYPRKTTKNHPSPFPSSSISQWQFLPFETFLFLCIWMQVRTKSEMIRSCLSTEWWFFPIKAKKTLQLAKKTKESSEQSSTFRITTHGFGHAKRKKTKPKKIRFPNDFMHGCIAKTSRLKRTLWWWHTHQQTQES